MKKLLVVLCAIWFGIIFYNSSNTGKVSQQKSRAVVSVIQNIETKTKETYKNWRKNSDKLNFILRKNAHFMEYLILAILLCAVFFAFNYKGKKIIIYILFITLFYAVTDEFHQKFVPGRTSSVSDIVIDFSGGIAGIFIFYLIYYKLGRILKTH